MHVKLRYLRKVVLLWEELRHNDVQAQQPQRHIASMAGDSETHLGDRGENTDVIRQPFLIGVSGGTASGKVGTLADRCSGFLKLSRLVFELSDSRSAAGCVDRVAPATHAEA